MFHGPVTPADCAKTHESIVNQHIWIYTVAFCVHIIMLWTHVCCLFCYNFSFPGMNEEIWEERLRNDLFSVGWHVKPYSVNHSDALKHV